MSKKQQPIMEEKKAKMLKFIMGKGHQPSAERLKVQKELFGFNRVRISHWNFLLLLWLFMASLHYFYGSVRISKLSKLENEYSTSLPKKYPYLSIDEKTRQSLFTIYQTMQCYKSHFNLTKIIKILISRLFENFKKTYSKWEILKQQVLSRVERLISVLYGGRAKKNCAVIM